MSHRDAVRRAETLRRVADLQRRQAMARAVAAGREAVAARARVAEALAEVARVAGMPVVDAGTLQGRQSAALAAAAMHAERGRQAVEAELAARQALADTVSASVVLRGRERLVERRREAHAESMRAVEQRLLDEIAVNARREVHP